MTRVVLYFILLLILVPFVMGKGQEVLTIPNCVGTMKLLLYQSPDCIPEGCTEISENRWDCPCHSNMVLRISSRTGDVIKCSMTAEYYLDETNKRSIPINVGIDPVDSTSDTDDTASFESLSAAVPSLIVFGVVIGIILLILAVVVIRRAINKELKEEERRDDST
jgi:hypothetical protein